ncbi:MAG: TRAP transporter large permease subunit [Geminicoccaceae bacterium]|nr:MAG: TRAP transporter large permease subunit [Geminicoccaceae bacterium]
MNPELGITMLGLLIVLILLGFPIAFTLIAMAVGFGYYAIGPAIFNLLVQRTFGVMSNQVLIAVPLFLFMGYMVERSNILEKLFRSLQTATSAIPGSLAVASLITCALFATATGIVGAVVTLMGLLALPAMLKAGYDKRIASGVICAGGCLGILIPPSIMLILYGATSGVSVVRLYAAAIGPGLMLAGLYIVYIIIRAWLNPSLAPKPPRPEVPPSYGQIVLDLATSFVPLALLIMAVLGAILFGLATPHEAAAMGAAGAILLAIAYRSFNFTKLKDSVHLTAKSTAMVCWLFVGSWAFSSVFSLLGGHSVIAAWFGGFDLQPWQFLVIAQLIIFLLGWPLEWTEIIVIFVPIFLPLLPVFGVDPLLFGILIALNIQTSFLTPPMAMSAFYLKGVAPKDTDLITIFKGIIPFLGLVFVAMFLVYQFPQIALGLPRLLYG